MASLFIPIKREYFDMIASGEKKEEYREIKPYWMKRLMMDVEVRNQAASYDDLIQWLNEGNDYDLSYSFQDFDYVTARNGYGKKKPTIKWEHEGISVGYGKPEWGAVALKKYFILKIGKLIKI